MSVDKEDYLTDIKSVPIFKNLDDDDIRKILKLAFVKEYGAGFHLFKEGMKGGIMYVILRGAAEIYIMDSSNNKKVLATIGYNSYIGEMSIIEETTRSASCRVVKPSVMLVMTKKCFDEIQQNYPIIGIKILKGILTTVSDRLRKCNEHLNEKKQV
ncbi:hypothetical protein DRP44_05375 [candidate division TA06 bacterium]|uniref:Cyclic nucleotide-binding domain-containing protein n=1 Tax=candidate division TA06 bacterium TaxID=2250710 RepID=A0A660S7M7_UNCT6|nr:MAG: hypothetical protein DRP44_05375 [candidate division TA06 bacterium]